MQVHYLRYTTHTSHSVLVNFPLPFPNCLSRIAFPELPFPGIVSTYIWMDRGTLIRYKILNCERQRTNAEPHGFRIRVSKCHGIYASRNNPFWFPNLILDAQYETASCEAYLHGRRTGWRERRGLFSLMILRWRITNCARTTSMRIATYTLIFVVFSFVRLSSKELLVGSERFKLLLLQYIRAAIGCTAFFSVWAESQSGSEI